MKRLATVIIAAVLITTGVFVFIGDFFADDSTELDDLVSGELARKRNTLEGIHSLIYEAETALEEDEDDYTANWQMAALSYFYGEFYVDDDSLKKDYFTECKDYALKAVEVNPDEPSGQYWLGVGYAMWAQANGIFKSLFYADEVEAQMTKCIGLNPAYFRGSPWAIRASVRAYAPGFSVGDKDGSLSDLESALEYGDDYRLIYQIAAEIYMHFKMWEEAEEAIEDGLALPYDSDRPLEEEDSISKLEEYQEEVADKLD